MASRLKLFFTVVLIIFFVSLNYCENLLFVAKIVPEKISKGDVPEILLNFKAKKNFRLNYYPLLSIEIKEYPEFFAPQKTEFTVEDFNVESEELKGIKFIKENTTFKIKIPLKDEKLPKKGSYKVRLVISGYYTDISTMVSISFKQDVLLEFKIIKKRRRRKR